MIVVFCFGYRARTCRGHLPLGDLYARSFTVPSMFWSVLALHGMTFWKQLPRDAPQAMRFSRKKITAWRVWLLLL